jgi:hypothetical protein
MPNDQQNPTDLASLARAALDQIGTFPDAVDLRAGHAHSPADADFIAAANPLAVLALLARVAALEEALRWANGEIGEWRDRQPGEGAFYWRREMMERANGKR